MLAAGSLVFGGPMLNRDDARVREVHLLHTEFGSTMPTTSFPVRESVVYRDLQRLVASIEQQEQSLQQAVRVWENQREQLEQQIAEITRQAMARREEDDAPAEVLQVLVWPPPPEYDIPSELQQAAATLQAVRPHEQLERIRSLQQRAAHLVEEWQPAESAAAEITQTLAVQGYLNLPIDSLDPLPYLGQVPPVFDAAAWLGGAGLPGLQLALELRRSYGKGLEFSNLPLPEDQRSLPLSPEVVRVAALHLPVGDSTFSLGRFPLHLGPGHHSLSITDAVPLDGLRFSAAYAGVQATHALGILSAEPADQDIPEVWLDDPLYGFETVNLLLVVHYLEIPLHWIRFGLGSQNLSAVPVGRILPESFLPGWGDPDSGLVNAQLVTDMTAVVSPWGEVYLQAGLQRPVEGWGSVPDTFAVLGGTRLQIRTEAADTRVGLEGGWTAADWGSFPQERALARFVQRGALGRGTRVVPLTSPYGPGAVWGGATVDVRTAEGFLFGFELDIQGTAEGADLVSSPFPADTGSRRLSAGVQTVVGWIWEDSIRVQLQPGVRFTDGNLRPYLAAGFQLTSDLY